MNTVTAIGVLRGPAESATKTPLAPAKAVYWIFLAVSAFYAATGWPGASALIALYPFALVRLALAASPRMAFYSGLTVGLLIAAGKLTFFWQIFGAASIALWLVYAFWIAVFVALASWVLRNWPTWATVAALPCAWCGLEYFRSECYYLRFSWLSPGLTLDAAKNAAALHVLGLYGMGLVLTLIGTLSVLSWRKSRLLSVLLLMAAVALAWGPFPALSRGSAKSNQLPIAGVQLEFPTEKEVLLWLGKLARTYPSAELLVLSEYTFTGPLPSSMTNWCREQHRYLIVGGEQPVSSAEFYNTVYVINPQGQIVFQQEKSVPIQFFRDGLPAREQKIWNSPWGPVGLCICYDLSYSRVTDRLVAAGAQALIVPTMDVADWGRRQHELHARIGPARAAEYGIPIFRLASSGISQAIDARGNVIGSAAFPGQGAMLSAMLPMPDQGQRPLDRWLAPAAALLTGSALAFLLLRSILKKGKRSQ